MSYMDDMLILDCDKERLKIIYKEITKKLESIKLEVNKKSNIYRLSNDVSFLGYTYILNDNKLIIKYNSNTIKKVKRKLHKLNRVDKVGYIKSFNSYKGIYIRLILN